MDGLWQNIIGGMVVLVVGGGTVWGCRGWWRRQALFDIYARSAEGACRETHLNGGPVWRVLADAGFRQKVLSEDYDELRQRAAFDHLLAGESITPEKRREFLDCFYRLVVDGMVENPHWQPRAERWIAARRGQPELPAAPPAPDPLPVQPVETVKPVAAPPAPASEGKVLLTLFSDRAPNPGEFVDREEERERFRRAWKEKEGTVLFHIGGAGGIGKTTLAAKLVSELLGERRLLWCDCNKVSLSLFFTELAYLTEDAHARERLQQQRKEDTDLPAVSGRVLDGMNALLVLDDFHVLCNTERRSDLDPLLKWLDQYGAHARVLLVSRVRPAVLDDPRLPTGMDEAQNLGGIPEEYAQRFLNAAGLELESERAAQAWERCGKGIPIAMRHFAHYAQQSGLKRALELPVYTSETAEEWWKSILAELPLEECELLRMASVFQGAVPATILEGMWDAGREDGQPSGVELRVRLQNRYLFDFDMQAETVRVHALLRVYCYEHLEAGAKRRYHRSAADAYLREAVGLKAAQVKAERQEWPMETQRRWIGLLDAAREQYLRAEAWDEAIQTAYPTYAAFGVWGEWARSRRICEEALEAATRSHDRRERAAWLHNLGIRLQLTGDLSEAR